MNKGLSQRELASIFKVSTGTVGNWEVGTREPDYATLTKLANFFNVSVDYLLGASYKEQEKKSTLFPQKSAGLWKGIERLTPPAKNL